eukprot:Lithocolla_globosa_v1_NODE_10143_length_630_cov_84.728696.p2 type:complete len:137 gc:universal NODE_10143_length_630_cov_84.728696:169-579(+)
MNYGPDAGKAAVIVDVLDQNRALVDGPTSGMPRQAVNFKRTTLTKQVVKITRGARTSTLKKVLAKDDVIKTVNASSLCKSLARKTTRASLSDFDRFKLMLLKKKKRAILNGAGASKKKAPAAAKPKAEKKGKKAAK